MNSFFYFYFYFYFYFDFFFFNHFSLSFAIFDLLSFQWSKQASSLTSNLCKRSSKFAHFNPPTQPTARHSNARISCRYHRAKLFFFFLLFFFSLPSRSLRFTAHFFFPINQSPHSFSPQHYHLASSISSLFLRFSPNHSWIPFFSNSFYFFDSFSFRFDLPIFLLFSSSFYFFQPVFFSFWFNSSPFFSFFFQPALIFQMEHVKKGIIYDFIPHLDYLIA